MEKNHQDETLHNPFAIYVRISRRDYFSYKSHRYLSARSVLFFRMAPILITIHGRTVDVTDFIGEHPGGESIILKFQGKDATQAFDRVGHSPEALNILNQLPLATQDEVVESSDSLSPIVVTPVVDTSSQQKEPTNDSKGNDFVWYILSALFGALAVAITSIASNLGDDLQNGHPKAGELGRGKFPIIGYIAGGGFNYPFRLQVPSVVSITTAWIGYTIHQVGQFYFLFAAKRARERGELKWDGWNWYSRSMFKFNLVFIFLHFAQSILFYDGLSSTVPEVTAQGSVIALLVVVYILEVPRRGLIFGTRPFEKRELWKEFCQFAKKYHGYIASFGIVYDYWYHPMEATAGHLTGFMFQFLLFWQSSLLFHQNHRNRFWTGFVESFVTIHAFITAIFQSGQIYLMFLYGFLFTFVMMQLWGLPIVYDYINLPTDEIVRTKRWRIVFIVSLGVYFIAAVINYAVAGLIRNVWMVVNIPAMLYISIFTYFIGYTIAYFLERFLVEKKLLERKSVMWYALATFWAFVFNILIVLHYSLYFRADLSVPKVTRDYFANPK